MIPRLSTQLLVLIAMTIVSTYSKEYILEDLVAMEDNNRRSTAHNSESSNANNNEETHKTTRQRTFVRQKKAEEGSNKIGGVTATEKSEKSISNSNTDNNSNTSSSSSSGSRSSVSNNSSSNNNSNNKDDDDEDRKTLAQQVADGKYGLIQKEIFKETPQRPGIISYEVNPEVPRDNVNNLGGLKAEDIWLAENHLLVLVGGGKYQEELASNSPKWPPIDSYRAPPRQVKIPPNPKVPPPFPVQLRPGGPTEFIRGVNGTGGPPQYPPIFPPANFSGQGLPPSPYFPPPSGYVQGNFSPGNGQIPFPFPIPPQLPQEIGRNGSIPRFPQLPLGGIFPPGIPPGANFLPPPGNITEQFDEDDPSIYYPPPYDFVYKRENTTAVPPGPLVPGIVLPPPPDFFAPLEDEKRVKPKRPIHKPKRPQPQIPSGYRGKSEYRFPLTTRRPSVQIVTDEPLQHLNEITPTTVEHALPPNAVVQGWVPIPAPRPFYITGPRKPIIKHTNIDNYRNSGYQYNKPIQNSYENSFQRPHGWNLADDNSSQQILFSPGINYEQGRYNNGGKVYLYPSTTIPPVPYESTPVTTVPGVPRNKAVKSFYFYDEPNQPRESTPRPPPLRRPMLGQHINQNIRPEAPVQYYYITKQPPPLESTTNKPPIFEYSYTAPGYGTIEEPRLSGQVTPSPPVQQLPPVAQFDLNNYYQLYNTPQSSTTTRTPPDDQGLRYSTTFAPPVTHSTTKRPETYGNHKAKIGDNRIPTSSPFILQTENPYHAYFTHHDYSLIDDITKKYFTIFGQKINSPDGATTPLPPIVPIEEIKSEAPEGNSKSNTKIKFPTESPIIHQTQKQPINNNQYYWSTTPRPIISGGGSGLGSEIGQYQQYPEYDYYYDDVANNAQKVNYAYKVLQQLYGINDGHHSAQLVQQHPQQPSYEGDTRVNFVQPLPTKDPDAEEFQQKPYKSRYQSPNYQQIRPSQFLGTSFVGRSQTNTGQAKEQPASLQGDTRVNYLNPRPPINQDAEVFDPKNIKLAYREYEAARLQNNGPANRPPSLHSDTNVNYLNPTPTPDPDAEVFDPSQLKPRYQQSQRVIDGTLNGQNNYYLLGGRVQQSQKLQQAGLSTTRPPSYHGDTDVNNLRPRPPINQDAEIFIPRTRQQIIANLYNDFIGRQQEGSLAHDTDVNKNYHGRPADPDSEVFDPNNPPKPLDFAGRNGEIVAYKLPGNGGGHFYFLTPQTAVQQQPQQTLDNLNYQQQQQLLQQNLFRRNVRRQSENDNKRLQENVNRNEETSKQSDQQDRRYNSRGETKRIRSNNNKENQTT